MKPAAFEYRRAESLDHALELLEEGGPDAKPLAGGQSLAPLLNMRFVRPSLLVDLNGIPDLDRLEPVNGSVRIGALARQSALSSTLVRDRVPLLAECAPLIGHFVTRNRGTVGGSIAHADGGAELPVALVTLGGTVVTRSRSGRARAAGGGVLPHALHDRTRAGGARDAHDLAGRWQRLGIRVRGARSAPWGFRARHRRVRRFASRTAGWRTRDCASAR